MPQPEGVIQFDLDHRDQDLERLPVDDAFRALKAWREILVRVRLLGQEPDLYGGYAYGNVSIRVGRPGAGRGRRSFLVTGSQTSGIKQLTLADCALVERWDSAGNRVASCGRTRPSSEALTHAAVYDAAPHIRAVVHAHSQVLWHRARALRLPITDPSAANGTPAMAAAIGNCWREGLFAERKILAMGGHEDGILTCGRSLEEAGLVLLKWLGRASTAERDANPVWSGTWSC